MFGRWWGRGRGRGWRRFGKWGGGWWWYYYNAPPVAQPLTPEARPPQAIQGESRKLQEPPVWWGPGWRWWYWWYYARKDEQE